MDAMIELISIHIPKTGGTSFYHILQQVYGETLSPSLRRRDYQALMERHGSLEAALGPGIRAVHGHLYYSELAPLHKASGARVVCWLRHPVERVVSNYRFFRHRLLHPELNPEVYEKNKHRTGEGLLAYASLDENRDRMSQFLEGIGLEELFFIGLLEDFETGVQQLSRRMGWPAVSAPHANKGALKGPQALEQGLFEQLAGLNRKDMALYESARQLAATQKGLWK